MPVENPHLAELRKRVTKAPTSPGVYRWKNVKGDVLYVGKAVNLRERLRSYVATKADKALGPWKLALRNHLADVEWTVTNSDLEALILETNLIKTIRPRYNVMMKDDKNYVYVEVTVGSPCPAIDVVRQMSNGKARYFGPFLSAWEVRRSLELLQMILGFQACKRGLDLCNRKQARGAPTSPCKDAEHVGIAREDTQKGKENPQEENRQGFPFALKPCLEYQIGKCNGLCIGAISTEEYRKRIDAVMDFFRGNRTGVAALAKEMMTKAAEEKKFERAGKLRDALRFIENQKEGQIVSDPHGTDLDVVGIALSNNRAQAVVLNVRKGKLIGEQVYPLMGEPENIVEALTGFLPQYLESQTELPAAVIVPEEFADRVLLAELCTKRSGRKVQILVPERGKKSHLLELAMTNAQEKLRAQETAWESAARNIEDALKELQTALALPSLPKRIEGYDISHLGGTETVGSMVVIENGKPANTEYRSFTLRTVLEGEIDDYKSLREVLRRRLRYLVDERRQWESKGIVIGKALKKDRQRLGVLLPMDHGTEIACMVARDSDGEIVGCGQLAALEGKVTMLMPIWIAKEYRGQRLWFALSRVLISLQKKGKIYSCATPETHDALSELGFLDIGSPPPSIARMCKATSIPVVIEAHRSKTDASLVVQPDLLVIDGGKGQLGAALDAMTAVGINLPVIGLAKKQEEIFLPGKKDALILRQESQGKYLLMRLRDEAHRFSNAHREKRLKHKAVGSALDDVPGIGSQTKSELLSKFGTVQGIKNASDQELLVVVNRSQLKSLRSTLQ